jgi:hypothetical protein
MNSASAGVGRSDFRTLLEGQADKLMLWTRPGHVRAAMMNVAIILLGAGLYGATMGWWRDPWQGFYVAIKFPLVILLTTLGNALVNAMLAPLLGLNIGFRQSLLAILMSFAITAAILGAFSPLIAFLVWNAPPMTPDVKFTLTYGFIKLTHVAVIAFAGIAGTVRLFQLLTRFGGSKTVARRVLFAWLAGNLFLGSQLTWIARPFIGAPHLPVAWLREGAFRGNFYENVFRTVMGLLQFD